MFNTFTKKEKSIQTQKEKTLTLTHKNMTFMYMTIEIMYVENFALNSLRRLSITVFTQKSSSTRFPDTTYVFLFRHKTIWTLPLFFKIFQILFLFRVWPPGNTKLSPPGKLTGGPLWTDTESRYSSVLCLSPPRLGKLLNDPNRDSFCNHTLSLVSLHNLRTMAAHSSSDSRYPPKEPRRHCIKAPELDTCSHKR